MRRGIFVTGTDTDVGKTVVSAALVHLARERVPVCYWKPVQTGGESDTEVVRALGQCEEEEIYDQGVRLRLPASPSFAALMEGFQIDVLGLVRNNVKYGATRRFWIVEGAGGLLVPLNDCLLLVDLIRLLRLPVLIVSRNQVGAINQTLLTIEGLRRRGMSVTGVVLNGSCDVGNREAIESFGLVRVLAELPPLDRLDPVAIREWAAANSELGNHVLGGSGQG